MKKRVIIPTILLTGALAIGSLGIAHVYAQESSSYSPIIQKLAERFGLNASDVEDVFQEVHADREANMLANFESRLDQAVDQGKITAEQKQLILDKQEEMKAKMDEWKDLPRDQHHEQMQAYHEDLKKWAEENSIELPLMMFRIGHGFNKEAKAGMIFEEKLD